MDETAIIELGQAVAKEMKEMANDIDAYLANDVPLECYRRDIDLKINTTKEKLVKMILATTNLPVEVKHSATPKCPVCDEQMKLNGMSCYCDFCGHHQIR